MGNISKKNRKKLVKVINANCHRVTHFGEQKCNVCSLRQQPTVCYLEISLHQR